MKKGKIFDVTQRKKKDTTSSHNPQATVKQTL